MTHKIIQTKDYLFIKDNKDIIAHLPLNNSPILEGIDLLPPLKDEVDLIYENMEDSFYEKYDDTFHYYSFAEGYNKAKEKYKFTLDDLIKAMRMYKGEFTKGIIYTQEQIIQVFFIFINYLVITFRV